MSYEYKPSTADRVGIIIFMVIGAGIVIWSGVVAVMRIVEVLAHEPIRATARFFGVETDLPIGPDGAPVPVSVDTAVVTGTELSSAGFGAALIAAVLGFLVTTTVVVCLTLLARNSLRGRVFGCANTALFTAAA